MNIYAIWILILTALFNFEKKQGIDDPAPAEPRSTIVLIAVDGMRSDALITAHTPTIDSLADFGAYTYSARTVQPTTSGATLTSLLTGVQPEQHGVQSNEWRPHNHDVTPSISQKEQESRFPTLFAVLQKKNPDIKAGAIYQWGSLVHFFENHLLDFHFKPFFQDEIGEEAGFSLTEEQPDFMFVHIDNVDAAGHSNGFMSSEYLTEIERADAIIQDIITTISDTDLKSEITFIITSDHGGIGRSHGGFSMQEIHVPWIISGKNIVKGKLLREPVQIYDTPATIFKLWDLPAPAMWDGKPILSVFENQDVPTPAFPYFPQNPGPGIQPAASDTTFRGTNLYNQVTLADGEKIHFTNYLNEGVIRYTTDGTEPDGKSAEYTKPVTIAGPTVLKAAIFSSNEHTLSTSSVTFLNAEERTSQPIMYHISDAENPAVLKDGTIDEYDLGKISLPDMSEGPFNARLKSSVDFDTTGTYQFYIAGCDISGTISIDGETILEFPSSTDCYNFEATLSSLSQNASQQVTLEKKSNSLSIELSEIRPGSEFHLFAEGPDLPLQPVIKNLMFSGKSRSDR